MLSASIGSFDFSQVRPVPDCITPSSSVSGDSETSSSVEDDGSTQLSGEADNSDALWANDGVVPLFSQWHPFPCRLVVLPLSWSNCMMVTDQRIKPNTVRTLR